MEIVKYKTEKSKPVSPKDVDDIFKNSIPTEIIDAFNTLIVKNYEPLNGYSIVEQEEIINIIKESTDFTESQIYNNHWLDVENIYEEAGWKVIYKSSKSYFKFSK